MGGVKAERRDGSIDFLVSLSPYLWAVAVAFYGVGDLATTFVGLAFESVVEVGPVAALTVYYGPMACLALKGGSFLACGLLWRAVPKPQRVGVPLGLALLGAVVTAWNLAVITAAT